MTLVGPAPGNDWGDYWFSDVYRDRDVLRALIAWCGGARSLTFRNSACGYL
ncbi:MAG: hypothetical protein MI976_08540 [Pseudomonadales bacterium]|nr:hypothetical protein [Pseudomonadales bacterium]